MIKPQRILLASAQEDFEFPLAEAARKQIFAQARKYHDDGRQVEILIISANRSSKEVVDDITVRVVPRRGLPMLFGYFSRFELIHYFGTTGLMALLTALLTPFKERYFTATDGGLYSVGKNTAQRRWLAPMIARSYQKIFVYTKYQWKLALDASGRFESRLELTGPILDQICPGNLPEQSRDPSILYMGHLSRFKGVDIVLEVFARLVREIPGLTLTLASNGLDYGDSRYQLVEETIAKFPGQVILKGRVDPFYELGRAHLLLYPFRYQAGTFAFPLSLYEALLCGTPFLSSDLDGSNEFFDKGFLCPSGDIDAFTARAAELIRGGKKVQGMITSNLNRIQNECSPEKKSCHTRSLG